jgi:dihydrofolate synthase / folylpolyglutamate synthase
MTSRPSRNCPSARHASAQRFLLDRIDYERAQSMPCSEEAMKLDRMRELLRRLGDPQAEIPIVHVAGTKGKGSTSAMLAAVLSAAGFRTGLFTSPHLDRIEERMAVDGRHCSTDEFVELIELVRPAVEALDQAAINGTGLISAPPLGPTYFEIVTAMALCYFVRREVGAAVLEVGLGGRLDSTNVCTPCVSIITSISFDHTKQLGETLAAIAAEKAGIIKPGVPVVSGVTDDEPREVVRRIARQSGCRVVELGVDFDFDYRPPRHLEQAASPGHLDFRRLSDPKAAWQDIAIRLVGRHQAANAALVLAAVEELRRIGWNIPEAAVRRGLAETVWPARVEVVARRPTIVIDAAHNAASIEALVEVLDESFSARRRILIFGTTQEKDLRGMLDRLLGRFDHVIFTRYVDNPRGVPPEDLSALAAQLVSAGPLAGDGPGVKTPSIEIAANPAEAWAAVHRLAEPDDLICITGSFFLAAEMRRQLALRPLSPSRPAGTCDSAE